jgi:hypothetical protein
VVRSTAQLPIIRRAHGEMGDACTRVVLVEEENTRLAVAAGTAEVSYNISMSERRAFVQDLRPKVPDLSG